MGDIFKIIGDLGMPVAAALAGGYFVYLTIKLLLQGVLGSIKGMAGIITALDNRVKTMNHDVVRIDTIVSNALGLRPDVDRFFVRHRIHQFFSLSLRYVLSKTIFLKMSVNFVFVVI